MGIHADTYECNIERAGQLELSNYAFIIGKKSFNGYRKSKYRWLEEKNFNTNLNMYNRILVNNDKDIFLNIKKAEKELKKSLISIENLKARYNVMEKVILRIQKDNKIKSNAMQEIIFSFFVFMALQSMTARHPIGNLIFSMRFAVLIYCVN